MFDRHVPELAESIEDIELIFVDELRPSEDGEGPDVRQKTGRAYVQVKMSTRKIRRFSVNLKSWYQSQDMLEEIKTMSAYLDNIRSEAQVRILPNGVGSRVPGEARWVHTIEYWEKVTEAAAALGYTEAQVHNAVLNYIDSQIP